MPTYQYLCRDCGHDFEAVQSMLDDGLTMCPECGGELRKVFTPPVISFKGSGFYATDHGRSKRKKEQPSKADRDGAKVTTDAKSESGASGSSTKESTKEPRNGKDAGSSSRSEAASS